MPTPGHEHERGKSVQFNLQGSSAPATPSESVGEINNDDVAIPEHRPESRSHPANGEDQRVTRNEQQRRRRRHSADGHGGTRRSRRDLDTQSPDRDRDKGRRSGGRRRARSQSAASDDSGETVVLPDRFDRDGRKKPERGDDPVAEKLEEILQGKGRMGRLLQRFTDLGGGAESGRR